MIVDIITKHLHLDIHGFSGLVVNKNYAGTGFKLMDKMWQTIKANGLKNNGINIWVYEPGESMFAGVQLDNIPAPGTGLEQKKIDLPGYAYYKHIGPYNMIQQAGLNMQDELKRKGIETILPYLEMYGHWTNDETKLETELIMCIGQASLVNH